MAGAIERSFNTQRAGASRPFFISLVGLAAAGVVLILIVTAPWGIGVSPDSVRYISMARNVLAGRGLTAVATDGTLQPVTMVPPLFPLALAGLGVFGLDPLPGARFLNSALLGVNAFLAGSCVFAQTRSRWWSVAAAALVVTSPPLLQVHAMAWSEPLFITFVVATIYQLGRFLETRRRSWLIGASVCTSLGCLTRYAGVALVGAGMGACLCTADSRLLDRIRRATMFGAVGLAGVGLWFLRNAHTAALARGDALSYHPIALEQYRVAAFAFTRWLIPEAGLAVQRLTLILAVLFAVRCLALFREQKWPGVAVAGVLYVAAHLTLYWVVNTFGGNDPMDDRAAAPLFGPAIMLAIPALRHWAASAKSQWTLVAIAAALSLLICTSGGRTANEGREIARDGLQYTGRHWRASAVVHAVSRLPSDSQVYTNAQDAIYLLTGRVTRGFPSKLKGTFGAYGLHAEPNERFMDEMAALTDRLRREGGVVAFFTTVPWRDRYQPTRSELLDGLPSTAIASASDGYVDRLGR